MNGQLTIFDWMPTLMDEPEVGAFVGETGAIICHIMRKSYIGLKVLYDCSTQNHTWYRCGVLEKYFECRGVMRSVINVGTKQRILLDHYPGREIYECLPLGAYPERMAAIGGRSRGNG